MKRILSAIAVMALSCNISVTYAADIDAGKVDKAFNTMAGYKDGADQGDLNYLGEAVVEAAKDVTKRQEMEKRLVAFISGGATDDGKTAACRFLVFVGSPDCVPVLRKLLDDAKFSHIARYALERIPGEAATDALCAALTTAAEKQKIGVVNSLGRRGDQKCVDELLKLANGASDPLAVAAVQALGRIDSRNAIRAVAGIEALASGNLKIAAADAYMSVAKRYCDQGSAGKAADIYEKLYSESEPVPVRIAALQGLAITDGKKATPCLIKELGGKNEKMKDAAVMGLRDVKGAAATVIISEQLPGMPVEVQAQLLLVLGDRGDDAGLPVVMKAVKSSEVSVRLAALQAIAAIGDSSTVSVLAGIAANARGLEQEGARSALDRLNARGVNKAMVDEIWKVPPAAQVELIRSLGSRGAIEAVPALLETARSTEAAVRLESLRQLRKLAEGKDVPALVALLVKTAEGDDRREAELATVFACRRIVDENGRAKSLAEALKNVKEVPVRCSILRVLGQVGDNSVLAVVAGLAKDENADLRDAAVRALAEWPNAGPMDVLEKFVTEAPVEIHRKLAMRGYVRMIDLVADRSERQKVALYEKAIAMSAGLDEKKMVLSKLGDYRIVPALTLVRKFINDEVLRDSAKFAADKIEKNMLAPAELTASQNNDGAKNAVDGNMGSRWDTGAPQKGGEWFLMDIGLEKEISSITLDCTGSNGDYPRGYEVYISNSKENFGKALVTGNGERPVTVIVVTPAKTGRYIKIVQTGTDPGAFWSIHEMKLDARIVAN